jgi:hypothetical protein
LEPRQGGGRRSKRVARGLTKLEAAREEGNREKHYIIYKEMNTTRGNERI